MGMEGERGGVHSEERDSLSATSNATEAKREEEALHAAWRPWERNGGKRREDSSRTEAHDDPHAG